MPVSEVDHAERWTILITPADGETWPDTQSVQVEGMIMRPDRITVVIDMDAPGYMAAIRGVALQKNGLPGRYGSTIRFSSDGGAPEWAAEIIESQLHRHDLYRKAFR